MLGGLAISLAATAADASEARYRLAIAPKPYADALIELGVQANVSVIGTSLCGGGGRVGVAGVLTLDAALSRLLAGAPCSYRVLDPRTVRIGEAIQTRRADPAPAATLVTELLVTATKRTASASRLATSVSVIPHDQIELTGAADVMGAAGQISGVLATNLGPGRDKLILRGLSDGAFTGRARSTVGSYLDDAAINYNAPDPDLQLVDVERVEVIRGPQGALYGSGALTGVFRIVTRKPDMSQFAFGAAGLAARTEGGSPSSEIEGYANLPLVHDGAALRIVGYRDIVGGYIDNASLRLSNVDQTVREGGRAALRLQPSDTWQIDLMAMDQRLRSNDTHYTTQVAGAAQRQNRVQEGHKNDFSEAAATVRGELAWASLRSSVTYLEHVFSSQYDASAAAAFAPFAVDPSDLGVYYERTKISMLSQDTLLQSVRPGPFSWMVGLYGVTSVEKSPSSLDFQAPQGALERVYEEHRRDKFQEAAIYGEGSYRFGGGWSVSLGGRLFANDVRTDAQVFAKPPTGSSRSFSKTRRSQGFSPKLSLQYEFSSEAMVYALYSEGDRTGGFNSGGFGVQRVTRTQFGPDRLQNLEVGAKGRFFDHRLSVRSSVFFDRWTKIQTDQYRPSGLAYTTNVGDADILGLEGEVTYDFDFGLSVQANALFGHSHTFNRNPDFGAEVINGVLTVPQLIDGLPTVPKISAGLLAVYRYPLPHGLTLHLIGETSYVGSSAISFDASQRTSMGQYSETRLSAQIARGPWTAALFIDNPRNTHSDTFAYGNPFTFGQVRQSTPQRPRTYGLRVAANY